MLACLRVSLHGENPRQAESTQKINAMTTSPTGKITQVRCCHASPACGDTRYTAARHRRHVQRTQSLTSPSGDPYSENQQDRSGNGDREHENDGPMRNGIDHVWPYPGKEGAYGVHMAKGDRKRNQVQQEQQQARPRPLPNPRSPPPAEQRNGGE